MISVKLQIDCLIKSNKIVIFLKESAEHDEVIPKAQLIYDQFKSDSFNHLISSSNNFTQSQVARQSSKISQINAQTAILDLLEMYGITRKFVSLIELNSLKNPELCENYIKVSYCNDMHIRYPLVFMHGIFFGSNDEIQFAHEEGFLFELFRDTGFYTLKENMPPSLVNMSNYTVSRNTSQLDKRADSLDFEEVLNNMENEYFSCDPTEDYSFAIQKIVHENVVDEKFDISKKFRSVSNIDTFKKSKLFRNISSESFQDINSDASSIVSINKDSYCRHYLETEQQQLQQQQQQQQNKSIPQSKANMTQHHRQQKEIYDVELKNLIDETKNVQKPTVKEKKFVSQSHGSMRQFTPPGDVLAKINTWMKKTNVAIENRNIQIAHRKQT